MPFRTRPYLVNAVHPWIEESLGLTGLASLHALVIVGIPISRQLCLMLCNKRLGATPGSLSSDFPSKATFRVSGVWHTGHMTKVGKLHCSDFIDSHRSTFCGLSYCTPVLPILLYCTLVLPILSSLDIPKICLRQDISEWAHK